MMNLQSLLKSLLYRCGYSVKRVRTTRSLDGKSNDCVDVLPLLHAVNPYEGFDFAAYPNDPRGWGGDSLAFKTLIERVRPRFIIEVGTWKGASALEMVRCAKAIALKPQILCIDTWLGALEFWGNQDDPERYRALNLQHGFPSVYYQFLANVCYAGAQQTIIPFPQTSAIAALWLRQNGLRADLIYVDASHEEEDVYQDLTDYWECLRPGGVLFGDDYTWDGVRMAVDRFAKERNLPLGFEVDKWFFTNPKDQQKATYRRFI